ncbi:MAG: O-antigen ligase family protein [Flavisolibacter sp.]
MGISTDKVLRQQFIFYAIVLMLIMLFTSRLVLSVGMILFVLLTCVHKNFIDQLKRFISNPFLAGMSILFFIPLLAGLWSEDKNSWLHIVRIKIPLLILPFAFAGDWQLSEKQWKQIAFVFIIGVFGGCCWSLWEYFHNIPAVNDSYLRAQLMPTPLEGDHVRFSLLVALSIVCTCLLFLKIENTAIRILLSVLNVFFIFYLHILSARTGLFSFYLFLLFIILYLILRLKKLKWVIGVSIFIPLLPLLAWLTLPTFQNRLRYLAYEFPYVRNESYLPGANDGNRMISLKAGWELLQENPFGVGTGDLMHATGQWYDKNYPQMRPSEKLYPSSEWLIYAGFAGWIALCFFTVIMLLPFTQNIRTQNFFWIVLNCLMSLSFLFDIGLEIQFGVFIYAFIVLWWWKWFQLKANS